MEDALKRVEILTAEIRHLEYHTDTSLPTVVDMYKPDRTWPVRITVPAETYRELWSKAMEERVAELTRLKRIIGAAERELSK
jgi:hypothetical protein